MPGTITFRPIEANLNHDSDLIGKADPYCMFIVGGEQIRGQTCKSGGKHPIWEDAITIPAGTQPTCFVEIKDKDIFKDDKLGSCEIDLREIESQGKLRKWYPIFLKDRPAGEILMEAIFTSQGGLSQGMGGMGAMGGMGMPLQGQGMPLQGQGMPLQGHGMPLQGQGVPLQGQGFQTQSYGMHTQGMMGAPVTTTTTTVKDTIILESAPMMTQAPLMQGAQLGGMTTMTDYACTGDSENLAEQYAREAVLRGVDPLGTHLGQPVPVPQHGHLGHNQPNMLPGQMNPGMQQLPGQHIIGQQIPGQHIIGQQLPGQQIIGHQIPGQHVIGQQIPGQHVIGQQIPGQQLPGQQVIGQHVPGQMGQHLPGQQNIL